MKKYNSLKQQYFSAKSFREIHHAVGAICLAAEKENLPLNLFVEKYISKSIANNVFNLKNAMLKRNVVGGTGTRQVLRQLNLWKIKLRI